MVDVLPFPVKVQLRYVPLQPPLPERPARLPMKAQPVALPKYAPPPSDCSAKLDVIKQFLKLQWAAPPPDPAPP